MDSTTYPPDPITPKEAARLLGVHVSAVYRWMATGKAPWWRLPSGHKRLSRADVLALPKPGRPRVQSRHPPVIEDERRLRNRRQRTIQTLRSVGAI